MNSTQTNTTTGYMDYSNPNNPNGTYMANGTTPNTNSGNFSINTNNITTDHLGGDYTPNSVLNYRNQLQQSQEYQRQYNSLSKPTQTENDLTDQITALNQSERQGLYNIEQQPIAMEFITGQQAAVSKQAAIKRLAASENLQALTGKRQTALDSIKTALGFTQNNLETALGLDKEFRSIAKEDRETSRQTLTSILDYAKGATFEELDTNTQQQIVNAVAETPMSLGLIKTAMQRNQVAYLDEKRKNQKDSYLTLGENSSIFDAKTGTFINTPTNTTGGYTKNQLSAITKINENVSKNSTYSKTTSMKTYADNVAASLGQGTGVGDIAAINQFQKVIDEGAVTRDQDVKLIAGAQSLANSLKTKIKKLEGGQQLSEEQRTQMKTLVNELYKSQVVALSKDPYIAAKKKEAEQYGLTLGDTILGELGSFGGQGQQNGNTNGGVVKTSAGEVKTDW